MSLVLEIGAERQSIAALTESVEGATSLAILRQVDGTVDSLVSMGKVFSGLAKTAHMLADKMSGLKPRVGVYFDPDDEFVGSLKSSYEATEAFIPKLLAKKSAIDEDDELKSHHCDMLHSAYREAIFAAGDLVEATKDLRAAIIRFDMAAEPRDIQAFDDASSLITALRSGD